MKHVVIVSLIIFVYTAGLVCAEDVSTYDDLVAAIRAAKAESRVRVEHAVAREKVRECWEIGRLIDEHILQHKERADYGKEVMPRLSRDLDISESELYYMLRFARGYPILPPAEELSWSHYRELLDLKDPKDRKKVEKQAIREGWSRDQLRKEVRRRNSYTEKKEDPLTYNDPGPLYTYRVVEAAYGPFHEKKTALDLGFATYHAPEALTSAFSAGDIVTVVENSLRKLDQGSDADLHTYSIDNLEVIDGDTLKAVVDLGYNIATEQTLRLKGIDAPDPTSSDGREAKMYLEKRLLGAERTVRIRTYTSGKYDRYIVDLFVDGEYINQELLDSKLAVRMDSE